MAYSYLVDISRWQGNVDHAAVAKAGISGCVIKASEGIKATTSTQTEAYFRAHAPVAKKAYDLHGAYHVLIPGSATAQVAWFLEELQAGYGGYEGCVVQLDCEDFSGGTPILSVADVAAWKQAWDKATGSYPVLLYAPKWYWQQVAGYSQLAGLGFAGWWPSAYVDGAGTVAQLAPKISNGWQGWAGLAAAVVQFSQKGQVNGVSGPVDLNEVRMPLARFRALATRSAQQEDELSAEFETKAEAQLARQGSQLDWIFDAVVGGKGDGWKTGALPVYIAKLAAEAASRDATTQSLIKALAANQGIGDAGVQKIIDAVTASQGLANQAAETALANALAKFVGAAVNTAPSTG